MMKNLAESIKVINTVRVRGKVTKIVGLVVEGYCPKSSVGTLCEITPLDDSPPVPAEVVGFREGRALLMPLGDLRGLGPGSLIKVCQTSATIHVGDELLGRVINAMEEPIDDGPRPQLGTKMPLYALPPNPMQRDKISQPLDLGIRAINGLLTCGSGQRMGILSGSGVGKSILLGMMAKHTQADVNVIALIGERGREVREFIERDLGPEGLARSVVLVVTSDQSPLIRMRGAFVATAIAEYFCQQGKNVLFMMDSVTRFAMAMREVGLAIGEPPTSQAGSITGLYTVLVEGDDMNEPIADAVRSILDGHILLSRDLAAKNHYPAIDIPHSASRVMRDIVSEKHTALAGKIREILATFNEAEDLVNIGAYSAGSNPKIDYTLSRIEAVNNFLRQDVDEQADVATTLAEMEKLLLDRRRAVRDDE
jgi:flagellum-specific ATP synthase